MIKPAKTDNNLDWPLDSLMVLILLSALLICFQYITLEKFEVLSPLTGLNLSGLLQTIQRAIPLRSIDFILSSLLQVIQRTIPLRPVDFILAGLIPMGFAILCVLEYRRKRVSLLLNKIFSVERHTRIALVLTSLILVRFYFARGAFHWTSDMGSHTTYAWLATRAFQRGEFPIWTNLLGNGSPYLQFYGPLFFYLVGLTGLVFRDPILSVKLVLAGMHVLSGLGMYCLVKTLCGSRRAGFLSALAFVLSFWHTHQIMIMGRLPVSVFYALIPWPFYFFEQLRFRLRRIPATIGGALTLGLLPFVHPGYAFWATALLILYVCTRFYMLKECLQNMGIYTFTLILGGIVFGAYLTVPMWVERANVGLEGGISYDVLPGPTWKHLIYWSSYRLRLLIFSGQHWYGAYLGISLILLTGLGYVGMIGRRQHPRASLLASGGLCLICSLILVFNRHLPVIDTLSVVRALQPGRYLLFVIFFLSIMVGGGVTLIVPRLSSRLQNRHYTLCLLFILCDLGPTTFQHPYISFRTEANLAGLSESARQELQNQSAEFQNSTLPNYRYFYFRDKPIGFSPNAWMPIHTGVPSVSHVYTEGPLAVDNFYEKFNRQVEPIFHTFEEPNDLTASDQFHWIAAGFYLLNVRHIYFYRSANNRLLSWSFRGNTPVIVSPNVSGWENWRKGPPLSPDQNVATLIHEMGVNIQNRTCNRIFLKGYAPREEMAMPAEVQVLEHRVWNQRVVLRIHTSSPCFARLAYAYYPYLRVLVNGQPVEALRTADEFIALRLEGGEHEIVLEPYLSPLRRTLLVVNMVLLALAAYVLLKYRQKITQHHGVIS